MSIYSSLAKDLAEKAAKEAAEKAAKEAAEKIAKEAAEKAIKEAAEKSIKEAAEKSVKEAAEKSVKEAAEKTVKETAEKGAKDTAKKVALGVGGLAAAGLAGYTFINPAVEADRKNRTTYTITSIEDDSSLIGDTAALISISPGEKISVQDTITITESDSQPSIDGTYNASQIISDTKFRIVTKSRLVHNGTKGKMNIKTEYSTQLAQTTQAEAGTVGQLIGNVGGTVLGGLGGGLLQGLGINYIWIIAIVIIVLSISSSIIASNV